MEDEIKLLQGYCGCLLDENTLMYIAEQQNLFVRFDYLTGNAQVMEKERLKGVARNLFLINGVIYVVTSKGAWIAESQLADTEFIYYDIGDGNEDYGDLLYVYNHQGVIHLFYKRDLLVITFDTVSKKMNKYYMGRAERYKEYKFEFACVYDGYLWMFSSVMQKMVIYSLEKRMIVEEKELPNVSKILYVVYENGGFYLLGDNTVYEMKDDWVPVATLESEELPLKMCVTNQVIWLLPGTGKDIYCFLRSSNTWEKVSDYPTDFAYLDEKNSSKYLSRCNSLESICWMMYRNNYFLKIDRKSDQIEWIKPKVVNRKYLLERVFEKGPFREKKEQTLKNYIDFVCCCDFKKP